MSNKGFINLSFWGFYLKSSATSRAVQCLFLADLLGTSGFERYLGTAR